MTVGELRKMIDGVDDNMPVVIPTSKDFKGVFSVYSPCSVGSGKSQLPACDDMTNDEIKELLLADKPLPQEDVMMLVYCGYGEDHEHTHELN